MARMRVAALALIGAATVSALGATGAAAATSAPATAPPAAGSIVLYLRGAFTLGARQVTIPRRAVRVEGIVRPYVPGQWVTMRVYFKGRLIHRYGVRIRPWANGSRGHVSFPVSSPAVGRVTVSVRHAANPKQAGFGARHAFTALEDNVSLYSSGPFVQLLQRRLSALHFFIPQTGVYDAGTGWALDAYHRLLHWGVYQTLDARTINALLNGTGTFTIRYPRDGRHAEGNLSDQLLALIDGSRVVWIFPISSGKPSTPTITGRFHVYLKTPGYLPDGMYYSNFFYGGYAIHGYDPAPDYPASHGCMRLPIADAIPVYDWLHMGDAVDVYY